MKATMALWNEFVFPEGQSRSQNNGDEADDSSAEALDRAFDDDGESGSSSDD